MNTAPFQSRLSASAEDDQYLLVVDDEPGVRNVLMRGLWEAGYQCTGAADGTEALGLLRRGRFALMLCDIRMPGMDGLALLPQAQAQDPDMAVIMVSAMAGLPTALRAIHEGAYDYLTKPFQLAEVELTVRRALEHRRLRLDNRVYLTNLEGLVQERTCQLRETSLGVITSLALGLEAKDEWTHDHSRRVAQLAEAIGKQLGLPAVECADLRLAGLLHDMGKIGVREAVLHKPAALTAEELCHIQLHPDLGARIIHPLVNLQHIVPMIRHHHERWDGGGYPDGLAGEAIPFGARLLGVADAYVAMREDRPYRRGRSKEQALIEIRIGARRQFDLHLVGALLELDRTRRLDRLDDDFPQDLPGMQVA